ncbi:MAG TPA: sigma-70 family RNA polymerase sigma factor [Planctomycetota bacterium]|nr:sigma-70 family RNA polymerase sigma factor [Planctomycetota bacterium]
MEHTRRQAVFDEWFRVHAALIFRIVRAYAFTPHDREDLLQEVALQMWNSIPRFRGESKDTTWIYRVALRSSMAWSQRERSHEHPQHPEESEAVPAPPPVDLDPRLEWIYARIAKLEPVERSLVLLHLDGLSYKEIAVTLGISEGNVGVKLSRIKKSMASESPRRTIHGL